MRRQQVIVISSFETTQEIVLEPWGEVHPIEPGGRVVVSYSSAAGGSPVGRVLRFFRPAPPIEIQVQDGFIKLWANGDGILDFVE